MRGSRFTMFTQLYKKEIREILPEIIIVIAITIGADGWVYFRMADQPSAILVPIFLTLGLAGFLPFFTSFKMLSSEWSHNTIYLIRSLPVSGGIVLGAKLLALFTQLVIGGVVAGGIGAIMAIKLIPEIQQVLTSYPEILARAEVGLVMGLLGFLYICSVSFLSQILGKLSRKFSGLISFVSFFGILYLVGKLSDLLGMSSEISNNNFQFFLHSQEAFSGVASIGIILITVLIFAIAAWIFEHRLEL